MSTDTPILHTVSHGQNHLPSCQVWQFQEESHRRVSRIPKIELKKATGIMMVNIQLENAHSIDNDDSREHICM